VWRGSPHRDSLTPLRPTCIALHSLLSARFWLIDMPLSSQPVCLSLSFSVISLVRLVAWLVGWLIICLSRGMGWSGCPRRAGRPSPSFLSLAHSITHSPTHSLHSLFRCLGLLYRLTRSVAAGPSSPFPSPHLLAYPACLPAWVPVSQPACLPACLPVSQRVGDRGVLTISM